MSKATPGPWFVEGRTVYALNDAGTNRFSALVQDAHTPPAELEANARQMAASHKLIDALSGLVEACDQPWPTMSQFRDYGDFLAERERREDVLEEAINTARAAIRDATGES